MRNLSNARFDGTLEEAVAVAFAPGTDCVSRIGYVVEGLAHRAGETITLTSMWDSMGNPAYPGEVVECWGLGNGSRWRVLRTVQGYRNLLHWWPAIDGHDVTDAGLTPVNGARHW